VRGGLSGTGDFPAQRLRHHRLHPREMVHDKEKLIEIGGVMHGLVLKWNEKK
jgi:hypothetical protein